jgi:benzil reductase ((S)-benzoin forming)
MASHLVIVTGGSSGIGRELIHACPYPEPQMLDISRRGGGAAEHIEADLATEAGWDIVDVFAKRVVGFTGERVVFIHNAGTLTPMGFAGEVDPAGYRRNVLLNSAAPQVLGDAFLRAAAQTDARCDLVLIGSGAATNPYPGWSSYGAAKAAAAQWVRTAGIEQEERDNHTHVWWIGPGVVATPMQAEIRSMTEAEFPRVERFRRLYDEDDLRDPEVVAEQLWEVLDQEHPNGAVLDLRQMYPD